jgi:RimJ/RimL family protein N-acetyltransferase
MTVDLPLRLAGSRVVLRDFTPDDVDDAVSIVGDDRVTRWLSFDSRDRAATARMLAAAMVAAQADPRTEYYLAITRTNDDQVIGFARLALGGVRAAKLGFAINADHWGRGYATDAARTIIGYGFTRLDLHRITAAIGPDNEASQAVVKNLGFRYEGRLRDHVFTNSAWRDSLLFSILDHELPRT